MIVLVHPHNGVLLAGELRKRIVMHQRDLFETIGGVLLNHVIDRGGIQHCEIEPSRHHVANAGVAGIIQLYVGRPRHLLHLR